MTKKEVKIENINNEVKEEEVVNVQEEETLEKEVVEEVKESKLKRGIDLIRNHKREIAIGAACIIGGMIGYALGHKEDNTATIESKDDYPWLTDKPEEPVDVEVTSEEEVMEEA